MNRKPGVRSGGAGVIVVDRQFGPSRVRETSRGFQRPT